MTAVSKESAILITGKWKLFTFPTCDFMLDSSFVAWDVRNLNPKISRSYELFRRRYSTSKVSSMGLWNFRYLPHLEADSWAFAINLYLWYRRKRSARPRKI